LKLNAIFYDGETASNVPVTVYLELKGIRFITGEIWEYHDLELYDRDAQTGQLSYRHRKLHGPSITLNFDGGLSDPARDYLHRISKKLTGDSNWYFFKWQVITAALIVGMIFIFYLGYPFINRAIVSIIPDSWAVKAGDLVVDALYQKYTSDACYTLDGAQALEKLVAELRVEGLTYPLRVEVVDNPQVNAMTAPGGRIVIFNGLLKKSESADEIAGILSHEIGHVYYQHPLQGLVNVLGFSIIGSFVGGDAATIAIVGLSLSYSRDLEREADRKALEILSASNISAYGILNFFERNQKKNEDNIAAEIEDIFSTHPLSEERITTFSEYIDQNEADKQFAPIMSEQDWLALISICDGEKNN
jgi:Zn-dependent protease with chaperone function